MNAARLKSLIQFIVSTNQCDKDTVLIQYQHDKNSNACTVNSVLIHDGVLDLITSTLEPPVKIDNLVNDIDNLADPRMYPVYADGVAVNYIEEVVHNELDHRLKAILLLSK